MSYLDIGFTPEFIREDTEAEKQKESLYQQEFLNFGTPASNIVGGVMQSNNGKLMIDFTQGLINYNDGVTDLLTVGGTNNNVNINSSAASSILNSG